MPIRKIIPGIEGVAEAVGTVIGLLLAKQRDTEQRAYEAQLRTQMESHQLDMLREELKNRWNIEASQRKAQVNIALSEREMQERLTAAQREQTQQIEGGKRAVDWEQLAVEREKIEAMKGQKGEQAKAQVIRDYNERIEDTKGRLNNLSIRKESMVKTYNELKTLVDSGEVNKEAGYKKIRELINDYVSSSGLSQEELTSLLKEGALILNPADAAFDATKLFDSIANRVSRKLNGLWDEKEAFITSGGMIGTTLAASRKPLEEAAGGGVAPVGGGESATTPIQTTFEPKGIGQESLKSFLTSGATSLGGVAAAPVKGVIKGAPKLWEMPFNDWLIALKHGAELATLPISGGTTSEVAGGAKEWLSENYKNISGNISALITAVSPSFNEGLPEKPVVKPEENLFNKYFNAPGDLGKISTAELKADYKKIYAEGNVIPEPPRRYPSRRGRMLKAIEDEFDRRGVSY